MGSRQRGEWLLGVAVLGLLLVVASIVLGNERLAGPPTGIADDFELPMGEPLGADMLLFSDAASGNSQIYAGSVETGAIVQLTDSTSFDSWRPRLSPDRTTVLFYRTPTGVLDTDPTQAGLFMVSTDGGNPVQVLAPNAHGWDAHASAEWSPAGTELAMAVQSDGQFDVVVTSADGVDVRSVIRGPGDSIDPSWSPDGGVIAYSGCVAAPCDAAAREIFLVSAVGGEPTQLTDDDVSDREPRFAPGGDDLAFRSYVDSARDRTWDVRIATSNRSRPPRSLGAPAGDRFAPAWLDQDTVVFHELGPDGSSTIRRSVVASGETQAVFGPEATGAYPEP